ncbi:hypothetical protein GS909_16615 [Rhodococcus hoagii]|nr:hypothetical protein [Prescottella equi]
MAHRAIGTRREVEVLGLATVLANHMLDASIVVRGARAVLRNVEVFDGLPEVLSQQVRGNAVAVSSGVLEELIFNLGDRPIDSDRCSSTRGRDEPT